MFLRRVFRFDLARCQRGRSAHAAELADFAVIVAANATNSRIGFATKSRGECVAGQCSHHIHRSMFHIFFGRQALNRFQSRGYGFWIRAGATQFRLQLAVYFPHLSAALRYAPRLRLWSKTGMSRKLLIFVHGIRINPYQSLLKTF